MCDVAGRGVVTGADAHRAACARHCSPHGDVDGQAGSRNSAASQEELKDHHQPGNRGQELYGGHENLNILLRMLMLVQKSALTSGPAKVMCPEDSYIVIRNSRLICGQLEKVD